MSSESAARPYFFNVITRAIGSVAGISSIRILGIAAQMGLAVVIVRTQGLRLLGIFYLMASWQLAAGTLLSVGTFAYCMKQIAALGEEKDPIAIRDLLTSAICIPALLTCLAEAIIWLPLFPPSVRFFPTLPHQFFFYLWPLAGLYSVRKILCDAAKSWSQANLGMFAEWTVIPLLLATVILIVSTLNLGRISDVALFQLMIVAELIVVAGLTLNFAFRIVARAGSWARALKSPRLRQLDIAACVRMGVAVATQVVFLNFPSFVMPHYLDATQIGLFGVGMRVAAGGMFLVEGVIAIYAPGFARLRAAAQFAELKSHYVQARRVMALVAMPALAAIVLLRAPILRVVGPRAIDASSVLVVVAVARFIQSIGGPVSYFFWMTGSELTEMLSTSAAIGAMIIATISFPLPWTAETAGLIVLIGFAARQALQMIILELNFRKRMIGDQLLANR